jgi:protease IV
MNGPSLPNPQPPAHHVVHIRTKPGGLWSAIGIIAGLALFGFVFLVGIIIGVSVMFAGSSMETVVLEQTYRDGGRNKIAILPIEGPIDDSQAIFARAAVDHILADRRVSAVVLRVDSPGGGVTASDQIWYEIERLKKSNLPVIASYGSVAASGGYYVSCGADHIIAEETCITGSIGVIAQIMTLEGLMDKIGIEPVTLVATGSPEKAVGNDIFRTWDEKDQQKWLGILDSAYAIFTDRVQQGRSGKVIDPALLESAASGSIFTASEAIEKGLVDAVGYLDDAIAHAEGAAGIPAGRAAVVRITEPPSLFGNGLLFQARTRAVPRSAGIDAAALRSFVNELSTPKAMYLLR